MTTKFEESRIEDEVCLDWARVEKHGSSSRHIPKFWRRRKQDGCSEWAAKKAPAMQFLLLERQRFHFCYLLAAGEAFSLFFFTYLLGSGHGPCLRFGGDGHRPYAELPLLPLSFAVVSSRLAYAKGRCLIT